MSGLKLIPIQPPVREDLVEKLERILERARSGEIIGISMVSTARTGNVVTSWTESGDLFRDIGALELLKHEMLAAKLREQS
jgi:hypothetical protein